MSKTNPNEVEFLANAKEYASIDDKKSLSIDEVLILFNGLYNKYKKAMNELEKLKAEFDAQGFFHAQEKEISRKTLDDNLTALSDEKNAEIAKLVKALKVKEKELDDDAKEIARLNELVAAKDEKLKTTLLFFLKRPKVILENFGEEGYHTLKQEFVRCGGDYSTLPNP